MAIQVIIIVELALTSIRMEGVRMVRAQLKSTCPNSSDAIGSPIRSEIMFDSSGDSKCL